MATETAAAKDASSSSSSAAAAAAAESYIGSFISLISKSDIRYEGLLSFLNVNDSTIGLNNGTLLYLY